LFLINIMKDEAKCLFSTKKQSIFSKDYFIFFTRLGELYIILLSIPFILEEENKN
jgi:hypothetical protein